MRRKKNRIATWKFNYKVNKRKLKRFTRIQTLFTTNEFFEIIVRKC